jgi:ubiquinone/menaquinone biosynthesis C-methylase UbiE
MELVSLRGEAETLEIGCGVGRAGLVLAPHGGSWTGAAISTNMLTHARKRLSALANVRLVHLSGIGLHEFEDSSFDVVYSTNVFAHLDEVERWRYVEEAFRVLREGGRIYIDNTDLESDAGWAIFLPVFSRDDDLTFGRNS